MTSPKRLSRARRSAPRGLTALLTPVWMACAAGGESAPIPADPAVREAEIAALEVRIERDRQTLGGMVTMPRDLEASPFHEDADLRAVAERLTKDADRLERLRGERPGTGDAQ